MSWFKSTIGKVVSQAKETVRDLNVVAREAARELSGGKVFDFSDVAEVCEKLKSTKSLTGAADVLNRLPRSPANAEFLISVIFAVAQNPLLRRCCHDFPPASLSDANPKLLPSAEDLFSMALFDLCKRSLRPEPVAWQQLLESYFRSTLAFDASAPPAAWLRRLIRVFSFDAEGEVLHAEGLILVRNLRIAREKLRGTPGDRTVAREAADLARQVHKNLLASEAKRTILTFERHAELSEITSEGEVYSQALDAKAAEFSSEAESLKLCVPQIDPQIENQIAEQIAQIESRMKSIMAEASEAQDALTRVTGSISALREKRKVNDSSMNQISRNMETATQQNAFLIAKEEMKMRTSESQGRICRDLLASLETASAISDDGTSRLSSVFPGRASQACQEYIAMQETALKIKRDALVSITDATDEAVNSALEIAREAESTWSAVEAFSRRFVNFVSPDGPLKSASDIFGEIRAAAGPFRERAAEIALQRELSQEAPQPEGGLKRKDSFEDLLGI